MSAPVDEYELIRIRNRWDRLQELLDYADVHLAKLSTSESLREQINRARDEVETDLETLSAIVRSTRKRTAAAGSS
jgi:hypothetical protein